MAFRRVIISGEKINDTKADLESFFTTRVFQTNYPGLKHKIKRIAIAIGYHILKKSKTHKQNGCNTRNS